MIRLECPLCGALVYEGAAEPTPGRCPGCDARIEGGGEDARSAVALALKAIGSDLGVEAVTRGLFSVDASHPLANRVALTSDTRDGFYRWWIALRGDDPLQLLSTLA